MKNSICYIFVILVLLVFLLGCTNSGQIAQEKKGDIISKEGYYVEVKEGWSENDSILGKCINERKYLEPGYLYTRTFYENNNSIIGKCTEYLGPGSSGGNKINCDSSRLLGNITVNGAILPKYFCVTAP